jgi:hypothetical protein
MIEQDYQGKLANYENHVATGTGNKTQIATGR